MKIDYSFYLVLDDSLCHPEKMPAMMHSLYSCGITCVQLRMKNSPADMIAKTGEILLSLLRQKNIPLLLNDHVEIAHAIDADGVHIGQQDTSYEYARQLLGSNKIIGLSIENFAQAQTCQHMHVDYYGVGPIYQTTTKKDAAPPLGIAKLHCITQLLAKPVVAIGGISATNVTSVLQTGVAGAAIVSAVLAATNPVQAASELNTLIKSRRS